jgi:hypothetical protein
MILRRVYPARESVATAAFALDLDTPRGHDVSEWRGGLEVDGIPADLHESVAVTVGVGACDVRTPVPDWVGGSSPDASIFRGDSRVVDVIAFEFGLEKKKVTHDQEKGHTEQRFRPNILNQGQRELLRISHSLG